MIDFEKIAQAAYDDEMAKIAYGSEVRGKAKGGISFRSSLHSPLTSTTSDSGKSSRSDLYKEQKARESWERSKKMVRESSPATNEQIVDSRRKKFESRMR